MSRVPPLGGFFGLELPDAAGGLLAHWGASGASWANATSALAALVAATGPGAVWFPAFLCPELTQAVPIAARRYYALDDGLAPDTPTLTPVSGDVVVGVNYFGRAAGDVWRALVAAHPGVTFVEDCAQTLDTGESGWGHWRLYSPRKLVGVPDGGLLVGRGVALPAPARPLVETVQAALAARLARMERPMENELWHPMNQAREAAHGVTDRGMSELSRRLLGLVDVARVSARRRGNFRVLAERLGDWSVLEVDDPGFVPFGFPVRLAPGQRDTVAQALFMQAIFPAVHWRELPAPRTFTRDWARAESYLTLPCDHRYDRADMERVAGAFRQAAG